MMERPEYITLNVFSVNINLVKEIILKLPKGVKIILGGKSVKYFIEELFSLNVENELIVTLVKKRTGLWNLGILIVEKYM